MSNLYLSETTVSKHRCLTCNKCYSTNSHLRRHEATHSQDRSIKCPFCDRNFARIDGVRRHSKTCSKKQKHSEMPLTKRGRKPKACDACRTKKVHCNSNQPCENCLSDGLECTYCHVKDATSTTLMSQAYAAHSMAPSDEGGNIDAGRIPVGFLLSYTDPSKSTTEVFLNDDGEQVETAAMQPGYYSEFYEHPGFTFDGDLESLFPGISLDFFTEPDVMTDMFSPITTSISPTTALETRMEELLSHLSAQHELSSRAHTMTEPAFPADAARTVFTAKNLVDHSWAYFNHFHHHCPLVHRATFDLETASLPLILAIFFCGLVRVASQHDALTTKRFFHLGEDYVYGLLQKAVATNDGRLTDDVVEIVQAALIMHFLQIGTNDVDTRRRIRTTRHPELVAALRTLNLMEPKHTVSCSASSWQQFVAEEVRIRTVSWVLAADCWCTLFFNNPPQITISEMTGDLPCAQELFGASTAAEFESLASLPAYSNQSRLCLRDWVSSLLQEEWRGSEEVYFHSVDLRHLQLCILALNSAIFVSRTSLLISLSSHTLLRATNRWKELWDAVHGRYTNEQLQAIGIARHSQETWTITRRLIEVAQSNDLRCRYSRGIPTDSLKDFHEFIQLYGMNLSTRELKNSK